MGIHFSSNNHDKLYTEIKDTLKRLLIDYQFWTDENVCKKFEVIYYDKLIKFRKSELLDVSSAIGYKHNGPVDKEKICKEIITHFKKRVELLSEICVVLDRSRDRLIRARRGPVCRNVNVKMDNFLMCNSIPNSLWLTEEEYQNMIKNLKKFDRYKDWEKWMDKLEDIYFDYLKKIFDVIKKIRDDIDNTMNDTEFSKLDMYARELIARLDKLTETYFLLVINYA